jgi:hypothetical protein
MRAVVLLILLFLTAGEAWSQPNEIVKDLQPYWQVSKGEQLEDYQGQAVRAIHLRITDQFKGGLISIEAPGEFTLFINGQLQLRRNSKFILHVDSLSARYAILPLVSIFQKANIKTIQTKLIHRGYSETENSIRPSTHFNDFVIVSVLLLFGFFVALFRFNTRLTLDYLNIAKVFSIQEREEAIVAGRIGSSVNILFFVFISLLYGLLLIIIFVSGPPVLHFSTTASTDSTATALWLWLLLSLAALLFLLMRLLIIWSMSSLFGFKGVVRFQFFHSVRSLFVVSALMGIALLIYYIAEFEKPYFFSFLLASACGFMILSTIFLYFKLLTRTSSTGFHLFFYLCGSEIISLMILIKVLMN